MRTTIVLTVMVASITSMLVSCSTAPKARNLPVAQAPSPSAESLLKRMARAYGSAKSYADSGVVYAYHNGAPDEASMSFRIHFLRPDHLRFDLTDNIGSSHLPENYRVLWSYGNATYSWERTYPQIQTNRDVTTTIAQFTGISRRSVHNIPSLLQTNFGWQEYLYKISSPRVVGEEVFEATDCYRIQGEGKGERRFEIWVGKSDYLIRKVRTTHSTFTSEEIHRGIAINQPISPEMLSFSPPMSAENHGQNSQGHFARLSDHDYQELVLAGNDFALKREPIPEAIQKLRPLEVYYYRANVIIALHRDAHEERGYYIVPVVSSHDPRFGENPDWTLTPLNIPGVYSAGLYEYCRKK